MSVREVGTAEFLQLAGRTEGKLVVVQFSATWCGPCRRVSPEYEALARTTPDVEFVKVYEHNSRDAMIAAGVRSMPTFHFYCRGAKVDECRGANIRAVEQRVVQHKGSASAMEEPVMIKLRFERERPRESGSGSILVAEEVELEVHAAEGLEILKFQVLSVTDIEANDQVLTTGDTSAVVDSDASLASALRRSGGGVYGNYPVLQVARRAAGAHAARQDDGAPNSWKQDVAGTTRQGALQTPKWNEGCSRIFFGKDPVLQPAYVIREESLLPLTDLTPLQKKGQGPESILVVCKACAENCFVLGRAEACPAISVSVGFVCQSKEACAKGYGADVFSERADAGGEVYPTGSAIRANAEDAAVAAAERVSHPTKGLPPPTGMAAENNDMMHMRQRVEGEVKRVLVYEDAGLRAEALSVLPKDGIDGGSVAERGREMAAAGGYSEEEGLARALLSWFKKDFFKWTNKPPCSKCGACGPKMEFKEVQSPTTAEAAWQASVVEVYRCKDCHALTRFVRYTDPVKLLETRTGRCGEWANCFTLLCRAVGLEARHVVDWTDYVWTEIWIPEKNCWVHADPCENKLDKPLMYEQGWKKRLSYVVAYDRDGAVDVTRRYTRQWLQVLSRRALVPEKWLAGVLASAGSCRGSARAAMIVIRLAEEQAELKSYETLSGHHGLSSEEQEGRQSGDADWIASRGEDGDGSSVPDRKSPEQCSCPMIGAPLGVLQQPGGGISLSLAAVLSDGNGRVGGSVLVGGANVCQASGRRVLCTAAIAASTGVLVDSRVFFGGGGGGGGVGVGGSSSASDAVITWLSGLPDSVVIAVAASGWTTTIDNTHEKSGFETAIHALLGGGSSVDGNPEAETNPAPTTLTAAVGHGKYDSWTLLGWKGTGSHEWTRRQYSDGSDESGSRCASYVELLFRRPHPANAVVKDTVCAAPEPTRIEMQDKLCMTPLCSVQVASAAPEALKAEEVNPPLRGLVKTAAQVAPAPHESTACCFPARGICVWEGEPAVYIGPTLELIECKGWNTVLEVCPALSEDSVAEVGAWRVTSVSPALGGWHDDTERFDDAAFGCPAFLMGSSPVVLPQGTPFLPVGRVREIVGWSGEYVNGVQVVYDVQGTVVRGPKHLGEHGLYRQSSLVLDLAAGEVVTKISIKAGGILDSLTVRTSSGRQKKWGGDGGGISHTWHIPLGCSFLGFHGGLGGHIHSLGVTLAEHKIIVQQTGSGSTMPHSTDHSLLPPTVTINLYCANPVRRSVAQMFAFNARASAIAAERENAVAQNATPVPPRIKTSEVSVVGAEGIVIVTALETALKYADNLLKSPLDQRVSRIRLANGYFHRKIGGLPGGGGLMRAMGFRLIADEGHLQYVFQREAAGGGLTGLRRARVVLAAMLAEFKSPTA